jgi:ABC-type dipeptide/oligopeptide/nickel transport system permease component
MGVIRLDFGVSPVTGQDALGMVLEALPNTLYLAGAILLLALPLGFAMGALGAFRPGSFIDRAANVISLAGISVVEFWLGLTLIVLRVMCGSDSGPLHRFRPSPACHPSFEFGALGSTGGWFPVGSGSGKRRGFLSASAFAATGSSSAIRTSSPAASGNASRLHGRWQSAPRSSFWTNRSRRLMSAFRHR